VFSSGGVVGLAASNRNFVARINDWNLRRDVRDLLIEVDLPLFLQFHDRERDEAFGD
jgi:hypothetical protein